MDQEIIMKANFLHREMEQLENNLQIVQEQMAELEQFSSNISSFEKAKNNELISSIGKGVHVKTSLLEKEFFVEVGSGIVVKKTIDETKTAIEEQVKRLKEVEVNLSGQIEIYESALNQIISQIEKNN